MKEYSWDYTQHKLNQYKMETKKKINWLKIWQIVRDLLVAILTAKEGAEML